MIIKVNKNYFKTKALIDIKSQSIGMMGRKFDQNFDSLLFVMGGRTQCFWMKNCIIPLDIIMIHNNKITKIHHDCPPCLEEDCPTYCGNGNLVLELMGGTCYELGIEEGDDVEYIFNFQFL